jgi:hypothetical protein
MKFEPGQVDEAIQYLLANRKDLGSIEIKLNKQRTIPQNSAIHLYCEWMASGLNDAGYTFTEFVEYIMKHGYSVDWTGDMFKTNVWHRIQRPIYPEAVNSKGDPSTAKLKSEQVTKVYEEANRFIGNIAGVTLPFPDRRG